MAHAGADAKQNDRTRLGDGLSEDRQVKGHEAALARGIGGYRTTR